MQIHDLVKPIDQMTDDELLERVRQLRHNRETLRPAARKIVERAVKKTVKAKVSKVAGLLDNLTEEQRLELIAKLGG